MREEWLKEAIWRGLEEVDTDDLLQAQALHITAKGEWMPGVISPSLIATQCPLQRLKRYLGLPYQPDAAPRMNIRAGKPDGVTNMNFIRGFDMEGALVKALLHVLGNRVVASAPHFVPSFKEAGLTYSGHPDMLLLDERGQLCLAQFKCPSVFKYERMERNMEKELGTYFAQLASEMFICRGAGIPVDRNILVMATWEMTVKHGHPRILTESVAWSDELAQIPRVVGQEVQEQALAALQDGIWPQAYPRHLWDSFPCSYCAYSRLGDAELGGGRVSCEDHAAWLPQPEKVIPLRQASG